MLRKFIISLCVAAGLVTASFAQTDQRTRETKIADIVMRLPAGNTAEFNRLMGELYQLDDVIAYLAPLLADPGGDDAQIRYAISGLAWYASRTESLKASLEKGLCAAIPKAASDEIRDFLFIQLQYVAGDGSVETAAAYLGNPRLCDAAARVLVRIGSDAAGKALLAALPDAKGAQQVSVVQALGELRYKPAVDLITPLAGTKDAGLQKAALYSLSAIADPKSEKALLAQVTTAAYEPTGALDAYLRYLENTLPGNPAAVAKSSKKLLKTVSEDTQIAAKSAALALYVSAAGEKAINEIIAALNSDQSAYRRAALKFSAKIASPKMYDALMKKAGNRKTSDDLQAELITAFGERNDKAAFAFVKDYLSASNSDLRRAAIVAAGKLDGESAVNPIIQAISAGDENVVQTGKKTLLSIQSDRLVPDVAAALPQASSLAKIALIEILASRNAVAQKEAVFAQTASPDAGVRLAADKALAALASENDAPRIAKLLNAASETKEIEALQRALFAAVSALPQAQQTQVVAAQAVAKPERYYNVLAMIGGQPALNIVLNAFKSNGVPAAAAFDALTRWRDATVIATLFDIAAAQPAGTFSNRALTAYISKVAASEHTPEQKLILLRKALDIAGTAEQKNDVIREIGQTGAFVGLLVAGSYLDDKAETVQQAAVQAVRTIALAHPEYYGKAVTAIIRKAIEVNKDAEAEYQKQALLKHLDALPPDDGFVPMFNGRDLSGWKGLVENPIARSKMSPKQLAQKQKKADDIMRRDWHVENGILVFDGPGYDNLCSEKMYGDFEMYVDWRIAPDGDAGIYLRGSPQVQIWDIARTDVGAQVGSGGLYNNQKHQSTPLLVADNPVNEWNSFYIKMTGEKVTVYLNGQLVTDNVTLENYWNRALPIFEKDAIELQAHGTRVEYRDIYIREIPRPDPYQVSDAEKAKGFVPLFNGIDMSGWVGNLRDYYVRNGHIVCDPEQGGYGNIYTDREYANFVLRFEFQLTPAANNGLGIRTPLEGDAAYVGMELQILDNEADVYKNLQIYQYHGSVYGVIPAKRGFLKPTGEWNTQEVIADGNHITVTLNGTVILDGDIAKASHNFTQTIDKLNHPGLSNKSGHIGFLGHGSPVAFRNLRIKEITGERRTGE
jgi:HEAT repeat protein